jgi:hypothetical protein
MRHLLAAALVATLGACALPGTPGPLPARDQCVIDTFGVRCDSFPPAPDAGMIRHE